MATYVNDLRLKEIATGDESGTWGTSTNTNLELIAEAFSYSTVATFDTDADKTETIADGATDPYRSIYVKVTSGVSLTATRTLTIAPNTVSKIFMIENATSGSQSIAISQGSGANVTIPNGDVKVIYTDGAGAGAAVVDAFASLNIGDLTATNIAGTLTTAAQTNITSVGTLSSLTVSGDATFDTDTLYVDSTDNRVGIGTTNPLQLLHLSDTADTGIQLTKEGVVSSRIQSVTTGLKFGVDASNGDTEIMRLTSTGLGIGVTNPSQLLHLSDTSDTGIELTKQGVVASRIQAVTTGLKFGVDASDGDTERMRIDNSGNVGIGTDSPDTLLELSKAAGTGTSLVKLANTSGGATSNIAQIDFELNNTFSGANVDVQIGAIKTNAGNEESAFYINTTSGTGTPTERMRIDSSGRLAVGISSSAGGVATFFGTGTGAEAKVQIEGEGGADPFVNFLVNNTTHWSVGARDSDSDKFMIANNSDLSSGVALTIDTSENVGIGTTSPVSIGGHTGVLTLFGSNATALVLKDSVSEKQLRLDDGDFSVRNSVGDTHLMVLNDGKVGIGTDSPAFNLTTQGSSGTVTVASKNTGGNASVYIEASNTNTAKLELAEAGTGSYSLQVGNDDALMFFDDLSERMRIDSSGNLLFNTTATDNNGYLSSKKQLLAEGSIVSSRMGTTASLAQNATANTYNFTTTAGIGLFTAMGTDPNNAWRAAAIVFSSGASLQIISLGSSNITVGSSGTTVTVQNTSASSQAIGWNMTLLG